MTYTSLDDTDFTREAKSGADGLRERPEKSVGVYREISLEITRDIGHVALEHATDIGVRAPVYRLREVDRPGISLPPKDIVGREVAMHHARVPGDTHERKNILERMSRLVGRELDLMQTRSGMIRISQVLHADSGIEEQQGLGHSRAEFPELREEVEFTLYPARMGEGAPIYVAFRSGLALRLATVVLAGGINTRGLKRTLFRRSIDLDGDERAIERRLVYRGLLAGLHATSYLEQMPAFAGKLHESVESIAYRRMLRI